MRNGKMLDGNTWNELKGIRFGRSFRWISSVEKTESDRVVCELQEPKNWGQSELSLPVEVLDSLFQTSMQLIMSRSGFMAPFSVRELNVSYQYRKGELVISETALVSSDHRSARMDVIASQEGSKSLKLDMREFMVVEASEEAFLRKEEKELLYEVVWRKEKGQRKDKRTKTENNGVFFANQERRAILMEGVKTVVVGAEEDIQITEETENVVNGLGMCSNGKQALRMVVVLWKRIVEVKRELKVYTVVVHANKVETSDPVNPWSRVMWSFGRNMTLECGNKMHMMVDVEDERLKGLEEETRLEHEMKGVEVAYRRGKRYTGTLEGVKDWISEEEGYVLEFQERGAISKLRYGRLKEFEDVEEGTMRVRVKASALNFRDVLNVLDMYPGEPGLMGLEYAGVDAENGERVFGLGSGCFANEITVVKDLSTKMPENAVR